MARVYVSSTFEDLQDHRRQVRLALDPTDGDATQQRGRWAGDGAMMLMSITRKSVGKLAAEILARHPLPRKAKKRKRPTA
jgi:hypothetical protein